MSTAENTPLLGDVEERIQHESEHDAVYNRFSPEYKRVIVALASLGGFTQSTQRISYQANSC
jgi:hypothetical protein